jgi:hypothetical protein
MSGNSNIALKKKHGIAMFNLTREVEPCNMYIKRNVDDEDQAGRLTSTILRKVYSKSEDIVPIDYQIDITPKILGSDMKVTNIRLFTDVIPEDT